MTRFYTSQRQIQRAWKVTGGWRILMRKILYTVHGIKRRRCKVKADEKLIDCKEENPLKWLLRASDSPLSHWKSLPFLLPCPRGHAGIYQLHLTCLISTLRNLECFFLSCPHFIPIDLDFDLKSSSSSSSSILSLLVASPPLKVGGSRGAPEHRDLYFLDDKDVELKNVSMIPFGHEDYDSLLLFS